MLLLAFIACVDHVTQVAGTGAVYSTHCAAEMEARGAEWFARCTPPACEEHFSSVSVGNLVVSINPAGKVAGTAERTCVQDLSNASALFQPVVPPEEPAADAAPAADAVPADAPKPAETK